MCVCLSYVSIIFGCCKYVVGMQGRDMYDFLVYPRDQMYDCCKSSSYRCVYCKCVHITSLNVACKSILGE